MLIQGIRDKTTKWIIDYDRIIVFPDGQPRFIRGVTREEILEQIDRVAARIDARM